MNDEELEKYLSANLGRVNEWLRFAETKNAALLTFSSAWLVAICSLWSNEKAPEIIKIPLLSATFPVMAAALIALHSLLPKKQKKSGQPGDPSLNNLLFHGNISTLGTSNALQAFQTRYCQSASGSKMNALEDLSTQLVETSTIVTLKFKAFSRGAWFIIAGFVTAIITLAILLFEKLAY